MYDAPYFTCNYAYPRCLKAYIMLVSKPLTVSSCQCQISRRRAFAPHNSIMLKHPATAVPAFLLPTSCMYTSLRRKLRRRVD